MQARIKNLLQSVADAFWLLPAVLVAGLALLGHFVVEMQHADAKPDWLPDGLVFGGGETGARTLLGAIASSTIGVAGTIFSITIAALTLATDQMGPRLLRNFMRDRGNQLTLGVLLGTFAYALVVLRSVRGGDDEFVPGLGVSVGLFLAGCCIASLIYFVQHVASRINVETVVDLVQQDLIDVVERLPPADEAAASAMEEAEWRWNAPIKAARAGYLRQLDCESLANWAAERDTRLKLLVRPGDYVLAGSTVALAPTDGLEADEAVSRAMALGRNAATPADLAYPIKQLVEVAMRALSPGINDPLTAINVIDQMGGALALIASRELPPRLIRHEGVVRLVTHSMSYEDVVQAMFAMIRQSAGRSPSVVLHLLQTLTRVAAIESRAERLESLRRLADSLLEEGRANFTNSQDLAELDTAHRLFLGIRRAPNGAVPLSSP